MDIALQGIEILLAMFTNLKNRNLTLIFVVIFVALTSYIVFSDFFKIDNCLDSGGKWNYETKVCES